MTTIEIVNIRLSILALAVHNNIPQEKLIQMHDFVMNGPAKDPEPTKGKK